MKRLIRSKLIQALAACLMIAVAIVVPVSGSIIRTHAQDSVTITEFSVSSVGDDITSGPDGNVWFTETGKNKFAKITTNGTVTEYSVTTSNSYPEGITAGPDGNLWFTEFLANKIGVASPTGAILHEYLVTTSNSRPNFITKGPDGNLWFTERDANKIGVITTNGTVTEYSIPTSNSYPFRITSGPDDNLWFVENGANKIAKITTSGTFTEYSIPTSNSAPDSITAGPDGNIWFTEQFGNKIGWITPSGTITEFTVPTNNSTPTGITSGLDDNLWFTEYNGNQFGRITPNGDFTEFSSPTGNQDLFSITQGPDTNLWFVDGANKIGRVNLSSTTPPPSVTLGDKAAQLAKSVVGAPYLGDGFTFGGKGYDWTNKLFVGSDQIKSGYNYYNNVDKKVEFGAGLDCAGLIFWAYNKAFGATQYQSLDNPIYYEGADGQYASNSKPVSNKADLQPGDLLFFSYDKGKSMHHVAMYVGGDDAVEAANTKVVLSKVSEMITRSDFFSYGRPTPPVIAGQIRAHSPISLVVTDPDGYTINDQTVIVTGEERLREVPRQLYYSEWNIDQNGRVDDTVTFPTLKTGNYFIKAVPKPEALSTDVYSLDIEVAGQTITLANNVPLQDIPSQGYGIKSTGSGISVFIPISIDIKPGSSVNSITLGSAGKIPVAILSSATFNAPAMVDKTSLTFGHTGNEHSLAFSNVEDVNGDGLLDLICQFNTQQTGFQTSDTQGILNGKTTSSIPIRGVDSVRIVP